MLGRRRSTADWEGLPQARSAADYAERAHNGQRRADGTPFIEHPLEVATLLHHAAAPDHVIAAGVLHDTIEKAGVSPSELRMRFGWRITSVVLAVSDDERIGGYTARKAALRRQVAGAGEEALMVFAADKLSKLRELQRETGATPGAPLRGTRVRRLRHYQRSLALLQERLPNSPLVHKLGDELASLVADCAPTQGQTRGQWAAGA